MSVPMITNAAPVASVELSGGVAVLLVLPPVLAGLLREPAVLVEGPTVAYVFAPVDDLLVRRAGAELVARAAVAAWPAQLAPDGAVAAFAWREPISGAWGVRVAVRLRLL